MNLKNLLLALLAFMIIVPINAQLRSPYRTDTYTLTRLQFPVENPDEKARDMQVVVKREALLERASEAVSDAVESDSRMGRLAAAATESGVVEDEAGALSDREVDKGTRTLIPDVFPAEGTYYLEVIASAEDWVYNMDLKEILFEPEAHGGNQSVGVKVEYNLYDRIGENKTLVHSDGPHWIVGRGEGDMMAGAEAKDNSKIDLAARWARQEVQDRYGLRFASTSVPAYRVRGLDRDDDREASDMQDELGELIQSFARQHRNEEYQSRVTENIAYWENMESQHVQGAESTRDAPVNDENVWTVYSNLAVAHFLAGNRTQANSYIDRAIELNTIPWEDVTNRDGEVIGRSRVGIVDTESIANLHIFKNMMNNYFDGVDAMNPAFVNFLADREAIAKATNTAREWGVNIFLSQLIADLEVPVEFVSSDLGSEQPSQVTGTITKNGNKIADYDISKSFLFFLTNSYRVKIETADGTVSTNQKNGSIMLPSYTYYTASLPLATRLVTSEVNTDTRAKWMPDRGINVMYDYDGNILLESNMRKERFWYNRHTSKEDALGYREMTHQFALEDDFSVKSVDFSSNRIDRERESGFGFYLGARFDKLLDPDFVLPTTVLFEEDRSGNITFSDDEMIVNSHGETSQYNIDKQTDSNGHWTKMTIGDIEITRTIEY